MVNLLANNIQQTHFELLPISTATVLKRNSYHRTWNEITYLNCTVIGSSAGDSTAKVPSPNLNGRKQEALIQIRNINTPYVKFCYVSHYIVAKRWKVLGLIPSRETNSLPILRTKSLHFLFPYTAEPIDPKRRGSFPIALCFMMAFEWLHRRCTHLLWTKNGVFHLGFMSFKTMQL